MAMDLFINQKLKVEQISDQFVWDKEVSQKRQFNPIC